VFIRYSRHATLLEAIADKLNQRKQSTWLALKQLEGEAFREEIKEQLVRQGS